jgi:hypothetical protein
MKLPGLFQNFVLGPWSERYFVQLFMRIHKSGLLHSTAHRFLGCERPYGSRGATEEHITPAGQQAIFLQDTVITVASDIKLHLLDPTTWS